MVPGRLALCSWAACSPGSRKWHGVDSDGTSSSAPPPSRVCIPSRKDAHRDASKSDTATRHAARSRCLTSASSKARPSYSAASRQASAAARAALSAPVPSSRTPLRSGATSNTLACATVIYESRCGSAAAASTAPRSTLATPQQSPCRARRLAATILEWAIVAGSAGPSSRAGSAVRSGCV